ncbi:MAG: MucBP domain-containing protein, partial [Erysipelotrichaceae bacterium]|nr:MucBP domain-containing protein [Erysipelotrichaceae bacterium]
MKKQYLLTIVFSIILQSIFWYSPVKASEEIEPYASYNFEGNLMDSKNHSQLTVLGSATNPGNSSTSFGKDDRGPFWQWNSNQSRGGGFYINIDKNIGAEYTIGLKFSFNQTGPGYKKIIDYKNSASDTGFYFYSNQLRFYNYSTNGRSNIGNNQVVNLIIQRSKDKIFRAYIVGDDGVPVLDLDVNDSQDQGVPHFDSVGTKLGFFYDDNVTSTEATNSGKIYMLKIWDKVIDVNNVLDKLENPEDVTVKYEDEDGNKLADDVILSGKMGEKVITEEKVFANYELKEVIPDGEVFFTDVPQTITYVYQKQQGADVTVKYEDEDGNK